MFYGDRNEDNDAPDTNESRRKFWTRFFVIGGILAVVFLIYGFC